VGHNDQNNNLGTFYNHLNRSDVSTSMSNTVLSSGKPQLRRMSPASREASFIHEVAGHGSDLLRLVLNYLVISPKKDSVPGDTWANYSDYFHSITEMPRDKKRKLLDKPIVSRAISLTKLFPSNFERFTDLIPLRTIHQQELKQTLPAIDAALNPETKLSHRVYVVSLPELWAFEVERALALPSLIHPSEAAYFRERTAVSGLLPNTSLAIKVLQRNLGVIPSTPQLSDQIKRAQASLRRHIPIRPQPAGQKQSLIEVARDLVMPGSDITLWYRLLQRAEGQK